MTLKILLALTLLAGAVQAQSVTGQAFGTYVNVAGTTSQSPVATLPSTGGMATGMSDAFGVPGSVDAKALNAVTTGDVGNKKSGAQSTSELENVSVAGGAITADVVTAVAASYAGQFTGGAGGDGYAVLNEQTRMGNGVTSWGVTVNMVHVFLQDALTGLNTGEIIVGSASSSVAN